MRTRRVASAAIVAIGHGAERRAAHPLALGPFEHEVDWEVEDVEAEALPLLSQVAQPMHVASNRMTPVKLDAGARDRVTAVGRCRGWVHRTST